MFQISRILVESKSPTWQKQADLRMTRVKDTDKGELLTFKEISWQTVRIEAKSTQNDDLTPLRLITNQARARITIKKKLSGKIQLSNKGYYGCERLADLVCTLLHTMHGPKRLKLRSHSVQKYLIVICIMPR